MNDEFYDIWRKVLKRHINETKENKMTRKEAIKKYMEATAWPEASSKMYIEGLEALGLIKFEEKKKVEVIDILKAHTSDWYSLIQELNENGWYIKK